MEDVAYPTLGVGQALVAALTQLLRDLAQAAVDARKGSPRAFWSRSALPGA